MFGELLGHDFYLVVYNLRARFPLAPCRDPYLDSNKTHTLGPKLYKAHPCPILSVKKIFDNFYMTLGISNPS